MTVKTALKRRELGAALTVGRVYIQIDERATVIKGAVLGENSLRTILDCNTNKEVWTKLLCRYSGKEITNKLGLLKSLFSHRLRKENVMGDHNFYLESQLTRPEVMGRTLEEDLKVAY